MKAVREIAWLLLGAVVVFSLCIMGEGEDCES